MFSPVFVELLACGIMTVFAFKTLQSQSLTDVINDKADNSEENRILKQRLLTPYVIHMYDRMSTLDNQKIKNGQHLTMGRMRVLQPKDGIKTDENHESTLTFNMSDVVNVNISFVHLVLSNIERLPRDIEIMSQSKEGRLAVYTTFGYITDVTTLIEMDSESFTVKFNSSGLAVGAMNEILAVYEDIPSTEMSSLNVPAFKPQRKKRSENTFNTILDESSSNNRTTNSNVCGVKPWVVNFAVLGWDGWLWIPVSYEANMCQGVCPTPFLEDYYNSTEYSVVKNYYHMATRFEKTNEVPRACCTPIDYDPLTILYLAKSGEVKRKTLANMKVTSCGCR